MGNPSETHMETESFLELKQEEIGSTVPSASYSRSNFDIPVLFVPEVSSLEFLYHFAALVNFKILCWSVSNGCVKILKFIRNPGEE